MPDVRATHDEAIKGYRERNINNCFTMNLINKHRTISHTIFHTSYPCVNRGMRLTTLASTKEMPMATSIVATHCLFCKPQAQRLRTDGQGPLQDLAGKTFGRLTVRHYAGKQPTNRVKMWCCLCLCGTTRLVVTHDLCAGRTQSCGCYNRDVRDARNLTHGRSHTNVYRRWWNMLRRCNEPQNTNYAAYGGRGIRVCDRWHDFANFYADMGDPPPGLTLERRDPNGPYTPENCYWASRHAQVRNLRKNRWLSSQGLTMILADWARHLGIAQSTIRRRLKRGLPLEEVLKSSRALRGKHA